MCTGGCQLHHDPDGSLLAQIGQSLGVSEAMVGQWISVYALGLLLGAIMDFAVANLVTALTPSFIVTMAARFIGGVSAGLLWRFWPVMRGSREFKKLRRRPG